MTDDDEGSDAIIPVTWMDSSTRQFLLEAGQRARLRYPAQWENFSARSCSRGWCSVTSSAAT
jgi:hypothetical protein